jgi:hypothetical protein
MPSLGGPAGSLPAPWLADTWCGSEGPTDDTVDAVDSSSPVIKVVYAYPSDQGDRFAAYKSMIQEQIKTISGLVYATSGQRKSLRFDLGTSCGPAYVDIQAIQLRHTLDFYRGYAVQGTLSRYDEIVNDVNGAMGSPSQRRNVLVYADYLGAPNLDGTSFNAAGQAMLIASPLGVSDQPGPHNPTNAGNLFAVAYGVGGFYFESNSQPFGDEVALHEITHTLGAVQDSAPHSSQASHCYDESDVLCYADGGSYFESGGSLVQSCSDSTHRVYDCNLDDYFNPSPAPGSYLATHWNLYDSVFLCDAGTCGGTDIGGSGGTPPTTPAPPPTVVVSPTPSGQNPPPRVRTPSRAAAFTSSALARAVGLVRARGRVAVHLHTRRPRVRVGRAVCPNVCRGSVAVYVLRGHGVRHTLRLGHLSFAVRAGRAVVLRLPLSSAARGQLRRHRTLNASLTLTANKASVTRHFTLRAA